jgi:hypothetical protein
MYQEQPTSDEIFRVIMIDKKRKVKINIQLRDESGDEIPIRETIEKLTEWVSDKVQSDSGNACQQQIVPLMGQAVAGGMIKLMGLSTATIMLSQEHTRYGLIYMMSVGFYLLKWLQKKNIKIHTFEEPVTDDDLAMYERVTRANDLSVQAAALGSDPKEIIKKLIESGQLKTSDLKQLGLELEDKKPAGVN